MREQTGQKARGLQPFEPGRAQGLEDIWLSRLAPESRAACARTILDARGVARPDKTLWEEGSPRGQKDGFLAKGQKGGDVLGQGCSQGCWIAGRLPGSKRAIRISASGK